MYATVTLSPAAIRAAMQDVMTGSVGARIVMKDTQVTGLHLRISKGQPQPREAGRQATCTWSWAGRAQGRMRTFSLGRYPHLGIAAARDEARKVQHGARFENRDPVAERRAASAPKLTLAGLLDKYEDAKGKDVASWSRQIRPAIARVFKPHLATPLASLPVTTLQATVDAWPTAMSASYSARCLKQVLIWATKSSRRLAEISLLDLEPRGEKPKRERVLQPAELRSLLPLLTDSADPFVIGHRLILLTACRLNEIQDARWRDMDLTSGLWSIPISKNKRSHALPLATQTIALLRAMRPAGAAPTDFVLIDADKNHRWEAATKALQTASGTEGWHRHDLRRTSATMLGSLNVADHVVEAVLNHVRKQSGPYNFGRNLPAMRDALQALADAYDNLTAGGGAVTELQAA